LPGKPYKPQAFVLIDRLFSTPGRRYKDLSRWRRVMWMTNVILVAYSVLALLAIYVPPARFWPAGFLTLSLPVVLAAHVGLLLFWLTARSRRAWFSALLLVAAFPLLKRTVALHWRSQPPESGRTFTVLSYNTQLFNAHDFYSEGNRSAPPRAIEWLSQNKADIKCLQEFYDQDGSRVFNSVSRIARAGNYNYYITPLAQREYTAKGFTGVAIFTKFPIVGSGDIVFGRRTLNKGIFVDVKIGRDTVRVFSVHLHSFSVRAESLELDNDYDEVKSGYRYVFRRLRQGFVIHSRQIATIDRYIRESPYPVIVCGDFNAMPYSFTYQKIRHRLHNAFEDAGFGFGFTLNDPKLFFLRIDNQFYSNNRLTVSRFRTRRDVTHSDHFPITATYTLK
jgi:endonuclease/exonuclease/phosphatase family metal-dependent hydrolase